MAEHAIYFMTCSDKSEAQKISMALLENKLIAGVNIVPNVESHYWWQGKIETANEVVLLMESTTSLNDEIIRCVRKLHSYDVPKVVQLPIAAGLPDYLKWISEHTNGENNG